MKRLLTIYLLILTTAVLKAQIPAQMQFNQNSNRLPVTPGLSLWFDAADAGSIVMDANKNISKWQDKSPNANHALQPTLANQCKLVLNSQNGLPAVIFPTTAAYFEGTKTGDYQTLVIVKNISSNTSLRRPETTFASPANTDFSLRMEGNILAHKYGGANSRDWNVGATDFTFVNGTVTNVPPPYTGRYRAVWSADHTYQYLENQDDGPYHIIESSTNTANIRTNQTYSISSTYMNGGMRLNTGICELLVYNRLLSTAERQALEAYLSRKWKITVSPAITKP